MPGVLYGIGVGPGDPELLTLKAVKVLKQVAHVFAAASSKNDYSLAYEIVREHLPEEVPVDYLAFPMTFDSGHLESAWQDNCEKVADVLRQGKNAAFLTLGDPMTFSTYIYLRRKVSEHLPGVTVTTIPGITSYQTAAARANVPLAEGEETFLVMPAIKGGDQLKEALAAADNLVLMKVYKEFPQLLRQLEQAGLRDCCCLVSRCGLDGELIERDFNKLTAMDRPNYLSLMLIKKRGLES